MSLTHGERPLRVFLAALAGVVLFDLTDGLYAALARRRIPVLSALGAAVHRLERVSGGGTSGAARTSR